MIIKRLSAITNEIKGIRMNYGGTKNAIEFFCSDVALKNCFYLSIPEREKTCKAAHKIVHDNFNRPK